jgi:chemotaxis protein MotB
MSRRRHRAHPNHERWLVSYADFITLLFAFFVVLYSSSRADQKKQQQVAQAINSAFQALGLFPGVGARPLPAASQPAMPEPPSAEDLTALKKQMEQVLGSLVGEHTVAIHLDREGLVISLREAGFFESGSARPKAEALPLLARIGAALNSTPYLIRIEGHTDNVPIHTAEFDSNWELSAARATHLARLFIGSPGIRPERLSASGYGEYHPAASNDTAEGRAENRRVDIIVLPRLAAADAAPEPAAGASLGAGDGDGDGPGGEESGWKKITDAP